MRVNQSTGEVVSDYQIRQALTNISYGPDADLSEFGYPTLETVARPDALADHEVIEGPAEEYEPGQWRQTWVQQPIPLPDSCSDLQALLAIDQLGYSAQYEAWTNDPARTFAEKAFVERATIWRRTDATFNAAADSLGFSEAEKDQFFVLAAAL